WTRTSATFSFCSPTSSCRTSSASEGASSSATDDLPRLDLLGVDLLERLRPVDARNLPLGGVRGRHRELEPELVADRPDPLREPLELGPGRPGPERARGQEPAGEPV